MNDDPLNPYDHIRIDERLLHGQILQAWFPLHDYAALIIADDECYRDCLLQSVMKMAIPPNVAISIVPIEESVKALSETPQRPLMLILKRLEDAVALLNQGFPCRKVIIGNTHSRNDRRQITESVFISQDELALWESLENSGVSVFIQTIPTEQPIDLKRCKEHFFSSPGEGASG